MGKSKLMLWTSYVTPGCIEELGNKGLLPIFIARGISNSGLIGGWHGTSIHFRELAPSPGLLREWKSGAIGKEEFDREFIKELATLDLSKVIRKLEILVNVSGAVGAVFMGYGKDIEGCHRGVISGICNRSGLLLNEVKEMEA